MTFHLGDDDVTIEDCRRYVGLYNTGYYAPARKSNRENDQDAYALFADGLSRDLPSLTRQLQFIGEDFGGATFIPFESVSRTIAERILTVGPDGSDYFAVLSDQPSMEVGAVTDQVVHRLVAPFVKLPPAVGVKRHFPAWASKVLHFARMDTFPTLEDATITALRMPSSVDYPGYVSRYRPDFLNALEDLRQLSADDPTSPTLLRRFDKVLYQLGLEVKDKTNCR